MCNRNLILIILLSLSGCASHLPLEITSSIEGSPEVSEALQGLEQHKGKLVRWGGTIASIENREDETWLEIVSRRLGRNGRPTQDDQSEGRFLVRMDQFLDPEIYSEGRLVTVHGELVGHQQGKIGDKPYTFPVIISKTLYLWEEYLEPQQLYPPGYWPYYDPYWDLYWHRRHFWGPRWY